MVRYLGAAWNGMLIGSIGASMVFCSVGVATGIEALWVGSLAAITIFILAFCQVLLSAGSVHQPNPQDDGQDTGGNA